MRGLWVLLALGWGGAGATAGEGLRGRVEGGGGRCEGGGCGHEGGMGRGREEGIKG
jgi:hypothetical protein